MELQLKKEGELYVAKATVNADYNVRVETMKKGVIVIKQSTVEGREGKIVFSQYVGDDGLFEQDYVNAVYPKYITIEANVMVSKGYLTEKGG